MTKQTSLLESRYCLVLFHFWRMFISVLLIIGGILMIVYTGKVVDFTGRFDFAENWFPGGGTYTFIKLLGLAMAILSFMWITGGLQGFLATFLGPIIPGSGY